MKNKKPTFDPLNLKYIASGIAIKAKAGLYRLEESGKIANLSRFLGRDLYTDLELISPEDTNNPIKLVDCLINFNRKKEIVKTSMIGMGSTIKEYMDNGDYDITIQIGIYNNNENNQTIDDTYPKEEMKKIISLLNNAKELLVKNEFLILFGITKIVITEYSLNQETYHNRQAIMIKALSDQSNSISYPEEPENSPSLHVLSPLIEFESESKDKKDKKTWELNKITSCKIIRDSESFTDTCEIKLPRKIKWKDEKEIPLKRGDKVTIYLGYNNKPEVGFIGYITNIKINVPITIYCEDSMYILKNTPTKKLAYQSVTLEKLLQDQGLENIDVEVSGEQNIGQYRVRANTVSQLLGNIKEEGSIQSFFKLIDDIPVLCSGMFFEPNKNKAQTFKTGVNIIKDDELEEQKKEDIKLKIKAISLSPTNERIESDDEKEEKDEKEQTLKETKTFYTYNRTKEQLNDWVQQKTKQYKFDGLKGKFTTFGTKLLEKNDPVQIMLHNNPDNGTYLVSKNVISFGSTGYRQEITLGRRIDL